LAAERRAVTDANVFAIIETRLAVTTWTTGDVDASRARLETAIARANAGDPVWTIVRVLDVSLIRLHATARRHEEILQFSDAATLRREQRARLQAGCAKAAMWSQGLTTPQALAFETGLAFADEAKANGARAPPSSRVAGSA
jgi:hypothetical protein